VPPTAGRVGGALHNITGQWNLYALIAHFLYLTAAACVAYHVVWRVYYDDEVAEFKRAFRRNVEYPITLAYPMMVSLFEFSNAPQHHCHVRFVPSEQCFFAMTATNWQLVLYWQILCGVLAYIIMYAIRAMRLLRQDPRSRTVVTIFLLACYAGVAACAARMMEAVFTHSLLLSVALQGVGCAGIAAGGFYSWRKKVKWFERPGWHTRRFRPQGYYHLD
jgi:hypothetical protein